jgi:hypothetical protein
MKKHLIVLLACLFVVMIGLLPEGASFCSGQSGTEPTT